MTVLEEERTATEVDELRDVRIEGVLRDWNVDFSFEPEFLIKKVDANYDGTQVRSSEHRAPRDMVDEYANQMRNGAVFPPMVATHNGRLIDGNTRKAAAARNGLETFPIYLVRLPRPDFGPMIGAALNQMGGKRLTPEEAMAVAEAMMREGYADEAIARYLGRSRAMVQNYRREHRYKEAAERTGVKELAVSRGVQRHLADITHDEPFKAAVELAAAAKVQPKDVQELVQRVVTARSEREELDTIAGYHEKWKPVGPPPQRVAPNRAALVAGRKVDALLAITTPAGELAPAALREELEPKWKKLRHFADDVLTAFREAPDAVTEATE